ncbi:MAG: D-alanine--D-alanine ligase [Deltaproteobacteria bacterium]|nr:MAG: D-alanine--D-alanine ligase [Deltaproteobacteria bacterium]
MKDSHFKSRKIGVLMGGLSREREISLKTGTAILKALLEKGYNACAIDVGHDIAEVLLKERIEGAFIALHGRFGEDGAIQGMLELMRIPYTGSGVLASALAMHKILSKKLFLHERIPTPPYEALCREEIEREAKVKISLGLPVVVKPAREGSTIGISIVQKEEDLLPALKRAAECDEEVLVEKFIRGKEVTVGILGDLPLPIIEIAPRSGFYDYRSKYTKGETQYIIPARLSRERYLETQEVSLKTFKALGCSGCVRIDVMADEEGTPYVIDVNTMPGMTETSLVPQAAQHAGIPFGDLAERILLGASLKI